MRISPLWTLRLTELPEFDCSGSLEAEGQSFLHEVPGQPVICPPRPDPEFITHLSLWLAQALLRCDFFVLFLGGITEDFGWLGFFHHLLFERNMDSHSWVLAFFPPRNWQTNLKIPYQIQIFWTNKKTLWSPWIFLCVGASKFSHLQMLKKKKKKVLYLCLMSIIYELTFIRKLLGILLPILYLCPFEHLRCMLAYLKFREVLKYDTWLISFTLDFLNLFEFLNF